MQKELTMIIIIADLKHKSLLYHFRNSEILAHSPPVNLMDTAFRMLGFPLNEQYKILEEAYIEYVLEKLESGGFHQFREQLHQTAEEIYFMFNTIKKLNAKEAK